jgi:hypothetical protein
VTGPICAPLSPSLNKLFKKVFKKKAVEATKLKEEKRDKANPEEQEGMPLILT